MGIKKKLQIHVWYKKFRMQTNFDFEQICGYEHVWHKSGIYCIYYILFSLNDSLLGTLFTINHFGVDFSAMRIQQPTENETCC